MAHMDNTDKITNTFAVHMRKAEMWATVIYATALIRLFVLNLSPLAEPLRHMCSSETVKSSQDLFGSAVHIAWLCPPAAAGYQYGNIFVFTGSSQSIFYLNICTASCCMLSCLSDHKANLAS